MPGKWRCSILRNCPRKIANAKAWKQHEKTHVEEWLCRWCECDSQPNSFCASSTLRRHVRNTHGIDLHGTALGNCRELRRDLPSYVFESCTVRDCSHQHSSDLLKRQEHIQSVHYQYFCYADEDIEDIVEHRNTAFFNILWYDMLNLSDSEEDSWTRPPHNDDGDGGSNNRPSMQSNLQQDHRDDAGTDPSTGLTPEPNQYPNVSENNLRLLHLHDMFRFPTLRGLPEDLTRNMHDTLGIGFLSARHILPATKVADDVPRGCLDDRDPLVMVLRAGAHQQSGSKEPLQTVESAGSSLKPEYSSHHLFQDLAKLSIQQHPFNHTSVPTDTPAAAEPQKPRSRATSSRPGHPRQSPSYRFASAVVGINIQLKYNDPWTACSSDVRRAASSRELLAEEIAVPTQCVE
jgi:hypothetical protein